MKVLIAVALFLIGVSASAQQIAVRNDNAATTLTGTNLQSIALAANSKGELYCASSGGASSLGKAEDSASADGDTGVGVLSVRQDSISTLTSTDGDYAAVKSDADGRLYVNPALTSPDKWSTSCSSAATGTSDTALVGAGGAGVRNYITSFVCSNDSSVKSLITLKDGSSQRWVDLLNTNTTSGSRISHVFPQPIRGTANTAFNFAMTTTGTSTTCCVTYFTSTN